MKWAAFLKTLLIRRIENHSTPEGFARLLRQWVNTDVTTNIVDQRIAEIVVREVASSKVRVVWGRFAAKLLSSRVINFIIVLVTSTRSGL